MKYKKNFWCKIGLHRWKLIITHKSFFGSLGYKYCCKCGKRKEWDDVV